AVGPAGESERPTVEADHPGVAEAARRLEEGDRAAEAEPDGEERRDVPALLRAEVRHRGRDVRLERRRRRLAHVREVLECVAPVARLVRPGEEVDGDRVDTDLREAKRQLLVVRVE